MIDKPRIGFVGLGLMGSAMVQRLLELGYPMAVLGNRSRIGPEAAVARGAAEVADGKALAEAAEIVMICLGTSDTVEDRVYGADGILAGLSPGTVVIDFGTSLPGSTRKIGADVAEKGATYLDAPLGRTPSHGREGKLNIMCAGDEAAFQRVRPVLEDLGENVFHLGPLGTGHTIKLINNFFAMTTACAMAEAFAMADAAGISRGTVYDVIAAGPNRSAMMDFIKAWAMDGRVDLAFSIKNGSKDVGYYREMVEGLGRVSTMSGCAAETLVAAIEDGRGDDMVPQIVDFLSPKDRS